MSRAATGAAGSLPETWRRLNFEQRVAACAALLLIVSTFGPFSFVEAAIVLTGVGVLALVKKRADRKRFHLPFGDGTVILTAGIWSALLIIVRLFDRPLGQSVLALACAAILAGAGVRERSKRPPDDLPPPPEPRLAARAGPGERGQAPRARPADSAARPTARAPDRAPAPRAPAGEDVTERLGPEDAPTERRSRPRGPSAPEPEPGAGPAGEDAPRRRAGPP